VAFVRYARVRDGSAPGEASPQRYAALVAASARRPPVMVPLGSADSIDALVRQWRLTVEQGGQHADAERDMCAAGGRLRRRVWDPIAAQLGTLATLFVVPDGELQLVNLAALPVGRSRYLVETGPLLHVLSAERDLVQPDAGEPGRGILAIGAPDFDRAPRPLTTSPAPGASPASASSAPGRGLRGLDPGAAGLRPLHFDALPEAGGELQTIGALWTRMSGVAGRGNVLLLQGREASEAAFKSLAPGRSVIHVATHGFFAGEVRERGDAAGGPNPLVRSGLAFAGANLRTHAHPDRDDGVLTAEEIATLDLSAAGWVVLSACESGAGTVVSGEGVLGLRRAFQIAGARTLIMSLWKVEDASARAWMTELYGARLVEGMSTAAAVRAASLALLRRERRLGQEIRPAAWGAFVATGDRRY
jgi:CHAT domain-containing protein